MADREREPQPSGELSDVAHIRKRPGMYVGCTSFFGFVQYLVSAFDIMLDHGATWIEFEVARNFRLSSDARVPIRLNDRGALEPFEAAGHVKPRHSPDAIILMALSEKFRVTQNDGETETTLTTSYGERESFQQSPAVPSKPGITLEFSPDVTIFSVVAVSPAVAHSYCKRTACLHPGVVFRIKNADEVTEYKSTEGIRDFFTAITTPYQILHKPIHIQESDGDLSVETVFAFHSWTENRIWSFANKGRVADGGTHEAGMLDAIAPLHNRQADSAVGVLAVLAIDYPRVAYEGCIKARISNPELRERVAKLVTVGLGRWVRDNPDEVEYLKTIERFQFADIW
jgi:topoisomerase-4 subunit B